ncbi:MAG: hypothetical protein AB1609_18790 [Bacillota bacterium]
MANKYAVVDESGNVVNVIIAEDETFNPGDGLKLVLLSDVDPVSPGDKWDGTRFCDRLSATISPNPVAVNDVVIVTAILPAGTLDTEVTFALEGGELVAEAVSNGQATHAYAFRQPGVYRIAVGSRHHGTAYVEVVVL